MCHTAAYDREYASRFACYCKGRQFVADDMYLSCLIVLTLGRTACARAESWQPPTPPRKFSSRCPYPSGR